MILPFVVLLKWTFIEDLPRLRRPVLKYKVEKMSVLYSAYLEANINMKAPNILYILYTESKVSVSPIKLKKNHIVPIFHLPVIGVRSQLLSTKWNKKKTPIIEKVLF